MNRNAILTVVLVILILVIASCSKKDFISYVNPSKLLQGYHGSVTKSKLFQTKAQVWQQRVDSLTTELQTLKQVSAANRANKEQQLLRYRDAIQQQAQQENQRLTKAVLEEINTYLKQYGKDHNYTFILGATESGNIVYAAEGTDITEDVLKGLNAQYDRQHPSSSL